MCSRTHAQTVEQWLKWGDAAMAQQEYYGASRFYSGALEIEPGRMALQWKQAEASRLSNQYDKAADLYERVYRKDQGRTYPDALRWLGEMQLSDGRYEAARDTWQKVLRKEKVANGYNALRARNALAGIAMAILPDTAGDATIEHLPTAINSFDSEFGARIGPDGALYFSTLRGEVNERGEVIDTADYRTRIVYTAIERPGEGPFPLPPAVNRNGSNANAAWSSDGTWFIFTRCGNGSCALYRAAITADGYGEAEPLPGVPEEALTTQPMLAMTAEGEVLFFVSDAAGSLGGTDIWQGKFTSGSVLDARPLSGQVNTTGNERTPWLDTSTGLLWFSSDMLPGFGGYDIFNVPMETLADAYPVNAGAPFNSPANDLYPAVYGATAEALITSNRKGSFAAKGETCCNDLYRIRLPGTGTEHPIAERVDTILHAPVIHTSASLEGISSRLPLKLYFHNDEPEPRTRSRTTRRTYAATYEAYRALFDLYRKANGDPTAIDAFFEHETEHGRAQLDTLVEALITAMRNGERVTLDVRGHASPLALNDYNRDLSLRRIASLRNHLMSVHDGLLRQYLDSTAANGAVLRLHALPFGEEQSRAGVSDDLNDLRHSVFSPEAARERRIEVERIHREDPRTLRRSQHEMTYDIGTVRQGVPRQFTLTVLNDAATDLHVLRGRSSCDCVQVITVPDMIAPGGSGILVLEYTGRTVPGKLERVIELEIEGSPAPFRLKVHGVVEE
ncbi:MAG: DUF1573 domain-containing protein [Flavobacteriales bacterium]